MVSMITKEFLAHKFQLVSS